MLDTLVKENVINNEQKQFVINLANEKRIPIPQALVESKVAGDQSNIIKVISRSMGFDFVDVLDIELDENITSLMSGQQAKNFPALPLYESEGYMLVAVPLELAKSIQTKDDIKRITNRRLVKFVISPRKDILRAIDQVYRIDSTIEKLSTEALKSTERNDLSIVEDDIPDEVASASQVVQFVDSVLSQAVKDRASDIHFDAGEHKVQIRYRIDGVLRNAYEAPKALLQEIVSHIKVLADLDISQTRMPQDGRISKVFDGRKIDMRIATLPSVWGEKIVMRILDNSQANLPLTQLDFSEDNLNKFLKAARKPYGMVLVTGPTGSGKSTTLYSALHEITTPEVNVLTVEDPVEYRMNGVTQVQVNNRSKMTFDNILRTFLRADPDIILVGEIRDHETAATAMQAGLTGHMVFSTLHTNDAASAIPRLADMGVEPFVTSSTLQAVASQRLVRKLCNKCKLEWSPDEKELEAVKYIAPLTDNETFFKPNGCISCKNTGYAGRMGIHEILLVTPEIQKAIIEGAKGVQIHDLAVSQGMTTLRQDGYQKVSMGLTSFQEIMRATAN